MPAPSSFGRASGRTTLASALSSRRDSSHPRPLRPRRFKQPRTCPHKPGEAGLESEERRITSAGETRPASPRQGQQQPKAAASNEPPPPEGCPSQQFQWAAPLPRPTTARRRARRARTRHLHRHLPRPILPHRTKKHPRVMNIGWTSPHRDLGFASVEDRKQNTRRRPEARDRPRNVV